MAEKYYFTSRNENIIVQEDGFLTVFTLFLLVILLSIVGIKGSGIIWREKQGEILRNNLQLEAFIYSGIMQEELFIDYLNQFSDSEKSFIQMPSIQVEYSRMGYYYHNEVLNEEDYKISIEAADLKSEKTSIHRYYIDLKKYD